MALRVGFSARCPFRVKNCADGPETPLPVCLEKRTIAGPQGMSQQVPKAEVTRRSMAKAASVQSPQLNSSSAPTRQATPVRKLIVPRMRLFHASQSEGVRFFASLSGPPCGAELA